MRFHFGISFRLNSLKKFIFPILLGLLSYFCFNYFNIATVQAETNMDTSYSFSLEQLDFTNVNIFSDVSAQKFFDDSISNFRTSNSQLFIYWVYNNYTYTFYSVIFNDVGYKDVALGGYDSYMEFAMSNPTTEKMLFTFNTSSNLSINVSLYSNYLSCLNDISLCSISSDTTDNNISVSVNPSFNGDFRIFEHTSSITNKDLSYDLGTISNYSYVYYSSVNLIFSTSNVISSYKKISLTVNDTLYTLNYGDYIPTYYDLFHSVSPELEREPQLEPEPEPESINVPFSKYVYWFGEHDSTNEILENIYCLLFLFLFGFMFLKILNIVRGVKW